MSASKRLLITLCALLAGSAGAYWAKNHRAMNEQIVCDGLPWEETGFERSGKQVKSVADYARAVLYVSGPGVCSADKGGGERVSGGLGFRGVEYATSYPPGFDKPTDAPSGAGRSLLAWNSWGGLWEDGFESMDDATMWGGRRAVNHFHDPLTGSGAYTGMTDTGSGAVLPYGNLLRKGTSVTNWVMNGDGAELGEKNRWGYPTIGECFHRAYTEFPDEKREAGLACAFRALGQVEHLVEDNTVPDHTRDLAHPGDGWEEYLKDSRSELFATAPKPWTLFPLKLIERGGLRALWDRDVYNGANPEITWVSSFDPPGLTEYVNANFYAWNRFTRFKAPIVFTTIPDEPGQPYKRGWSLAPPGAGKPTPLPFLSLRTNSAEYPFPKWVDDGSTLLHPQPGTQGHLVAHRVPESSTLDETNAVWKEWAGPLLSHALGYAQTAVTLALPPSRMELVASPAGDPLKLTVRLWNLWQPGSPHAVTWHVDELDAAEVDSIGRPADEELKRIQKDDARVAAVALVSFSRERTLEVIHPAQSSLVLPGSTLVPGSQPGVYVRAPTAADQPHGPLTFEVDLHLNDFYRADLGEPLLDSARTSGTISLAVWTTAGGVQLQRLVVWPWLNPGTAQALIAPDACQVNDVPHTAIVHESRGICTHSATTVNPCGDYQYRRQVVEVTWADPGYAQQRAVWRSENLGVTRAPDWTFRLTAQ